LFGSFFPAYAARIRVKEDILEWFMMVAHLSLVWNRVKEGILEWFMFVHLSLVWKRVKEGILE